MANVIYFIERESDGAVKIGTTNNLRDRISRLRSKHGSLICLGYIEGSKVREKVLHWCFNAQRIEGEWFHKTSELSSLIKEYSTPYNPPPVVVENTGQGVGVTFNYFELNRIIEKSGLSKRQVANRLGLHLNTIVAWTNPPTPNAKIVRVPTPDKLAILLKELGWSVDEIRANWSSFYNIDCNGNAAL